MKVATIKLVKVMKKQLDEFTIFQDFVDHKIENKLDDNDVFVEWSFPEGYFIVDYDLNSKHRILIIQHKDYPSQYFMFTWTGSLNEMPSCGECEEYFPPQKRHWREVL